MKIAYTRQLSNLNFFQYTNMIIMDQGYYLYLKGEETF